MKAMPEILNTDVQIVLPLCIPYEVIAGGSCRDAILGEQPADYDLFYSDTEMYKRACRALHRYGLRRTSVLEDTWKDAPSRTEVWVGEQFKFDMILRKCPIGRTLYVILNEFDFHMNCAFQKQGENIRVKKDSLPMIHSRVAEICDRNMSLSITIGRGKKFRDRGWEMGAGTVSYMLEKAAIVLKNPEVHRQTEKRFVEFEEWSPSSGHYIVKMQDLLDDMLYLTNTDSLTLWFLSNNDELMNAARKEFARREGRHVV